MRNRLLAVLAVLVAGVVYADTSAIYDYLTLGKAGAKTGQLRLYNASNSNVITIKPGTPSASTTYTLPLADGTASQVLKTNGSGVLSWGDSFSFSLNGLTGPVQTFSKVDDTNVTLGIGSTGTAHTFTAGWSGLLSVARGGTNLATATDDNLMVGNGTTWESKALVACTDIGGSHLNYDASTNTFSCGTSSSTVTFTGGAITTPILAPAADNCASVPYSFSGDTNTGLCSSGADTVWIYAGGVGIMRVLAANIYIPDYPIALGVTSGVQSASGETGLFFGATGDLYLRDGVAPYTTPQLLHWSHAYTDASNYQGGVLKTSSTGIEIATETAGSGADNLDITLTPAGTGVVKTPKLALSGETSVFDLTSVNLGIYSSGSPLILLNSSGLKGLQTTSDGFFGWSSSTTSSVTSDTTLQREAAGVVGVRDGTTGGAAFGFVEQTAPAAPAANGARLYAKDNGAGKTQLCVLFSSGAEQCFATQP